MGGVVDLGVVGFSGVGVLGCFVDYYWSVSQQVPELHQIEVPNPLAYCRECAP